MEEYHSNHKQKRNLNINPKHTKNPGINIYNDICLVWKITVSNLIDVAHIELWGNVKCDVKPKLIVKLCNKL